MEELIMSDSGFHEIPEKGLRRLWNDIFGFIEIKHTSNESKEASQKIAKLVKMRHMQMEVKASHPDNEKLCLAINSRISGITARIEELSCKVGSSHE